MASEVGCRGLKIGEKRIRLNTWKVVGEKDAGSNLGPFLLL